MVSKSGAKFTLLRRTPLEAISTDSGFGAVQELLARIEHGMYA